MQTKAIQENSQALAEGWHAPGLKDGEL